MMDWIECSWRHKVKHIEQINLDGPNEHTEFGGTIHDAIEQYLLGNGPLDPEATAKKVEETLLTLPKFTGNAAEWAATVAPIFEELPGFLSKTFSNYSVVSAEFPLMEAIEKKQERFFKGFIDCILKTEVHNPTDSSQPPEEIYWIIDWKTSDWGWTGQKKRDPLKQMQLVLYKHFWCTKNNIPFDKVKCGWVILKRTAKPGEHIELVPVTVEAKDIEHAVGMVYKMLGSMEKKIFTKNRNHCRFCPYLNTEHCT